METSLKGLFAIIIVFLIAQIVWLYRNSDHLKKAIQLIETAQKNLDSAGHVLYRTEDMVLHLSVLNENMMDSLSVFKKSTGEVDKRFLAMEEQLVKAMEGMDKKILEYKKEQNKINQEINKLPSGIETKKLD